MGIRDREVYNLPYFAIPIWVGVKKLALLCLTLPYFATSKLQSGTDCWCNASMFCTIISNLWFNCIVSASGNAPKVSALKYLTTRNAVFLLSEVPPAYIRHLTLRSASRGERHPNGCLSLFVVQLFNRKMFLYFKYSHYLCRRKPKQQAIWNTRRPMPKSECIASKCHVPSLTSRKESQGLK